MSNYFPQVGSQFLVFPGVNFVKVFLFSFKYFYSKVNFESHTFLANFYLVSVRKAFIAGPH